MYPLSDVKRLTFTDTKAEVDTFGTKIHVIVLDLARPIVRKRVFNPASKHPTESRLVPEAQSGTERQYLSFAQAAPPFT